MARSRTAAAGLGDNHEPLNKEDKAALQHFYARRIRTGKAAIAEVRSLLKSKQTAVNSDFALVKGQLQINREEFEDMLRLEDMSAAEFEAHEAKRAERLENHGLVSGQLDLALGDTADDKARAYADGKRAYLRFEEAVPPAHIHPVCHQDWMAGFMDEQTASVMKMGRAEAILARIDEAKKAAESEAAADDEDDLDEEAEEFDPDAEAKRLKKAGFTERGPVGADEELAVA